MPGSLDSCINSTYEDGNIPASSGLPPVRVLLRDAIEAAITEAAAAEDAQFVGLFGAIVEAATADAVQDWIAGGVARSAMLPEAMINSDGTPRQANVNGTMVNL